MIHLNSNIFQVISKDYFKNLFIKIKQNYTFKTSAMKYNFLFNHILFWENNELNEDLLNTILLKPFNEMIKKYPELNNYILTCQLVFYSSSISNLNFKNMSNDEKKTIIISYVSKYNNKWIEPIMNQQSYYKSKKAFSYFISTINIELMKLNDYISSFINYIYIDSDMRHELLINLESSVCPYCNRQYITPYDDNGKLKTTADLDHFYPKSIFTLFSLSLYNFVPACQICNSRFKLAQGYKILYPYDQGFSENAKFNLKINTTSDINSLIGDNSNFELDIELFNNGNYNEEIKNNIKLFHLKELYDIHKDYVRELLYKKYVYANTYKEQLVTLFKELNLDEHEINLFLYGNTLQIEDLGKKPLSKLAYDILND
ncbi:hypothetical protein L2089_05110 [Paenibacillus hunanensis]|uniref:hypothetical protein n=1 Tax=Paenibacillus hunanensis TaxID=539262 RepID=UPI0020263B32|nr:hypothetical protein [Paenibacillus hunanensis]MCL9660054.1 hypothetical protein [Paenibacillus hunanensis]